MTRLQRTWALSVSLVGSAVLPIPLVLAGIDFRVVMAAVALFFVFFILFVLNTFAHRCPRCNAQVMRHDSPTGRLFPPKICPRCGVTLKWR